MLIIMQCNTKSQYPLTDYITPCYSRFMQEALNIRIDPELKARLQERAVLEDRTLTQIVIKALTQAATRWNQPTGKKASK